MIKPPYHVPSMIEVNAIPYNGFKVISTFSGGGGSSLGYRMAGYNVIWANEFVESARQTYAANFPATLIDSRSIRDIRASDILTNIGLRIGELDILDGSPPCAAFSTVGKRDKGWGKQKSYSDTSQQVDDLFFEYARLLEGLQPKIFIAENVSGLIKGVAKGYFLNILQTLKLCGYHVIAKLLDSRWLGVPQKRQRIIFIGVRNDLDIQPTFPAPLPYFYNLYDAFGNECRVLPIEPETDISRFAIGNEWEKFCYGKSPKYISLCKPDPSGPCNTITVGSNRLFSPSAFCSAARPVHPLEKRHFSIMELKRLCSFPDDFVVTGTYMQQYERFGRAVPPVMMYHIANTVKESILCKIA